MAPPNLAPASFNPKVLEELYAYWPIRPYGLGEAAVRKLKHSASSTDDPRSPLYILRRDKRPNMKFDVNPEIRGSYSSPGYDFLNDQARRQWLRWVNTMNTNKWWGKGYDVMPVTHQSEVLAHYCLAYWANAIQEGSMTLSLHSGDKEHAKVGKNYPRGFININGHESASFSGEYLLALELRDTAMALLGAFGKSPEQIPSNFDIPFPRKNIWDIPGGKMIVVPENYEDRDAGVQTIRLIPGKLVEKLKTASSKILAKRE
jgi:hypothetical protein